MKKKILPMIVFICSLLTLLISLELFYNMGVFVDEYNTTPAVVCGSEFWLIMDWLRLALAALSVMLSGVQLVRR